MTVNRLLIGLLFTGDNQDTLNLTATLSGLPAGFNANGKTLTLNVNGLLLPYILDAKGKSADGAVTLTLKGKRDPRTKLTLFPGGSAPMSIRLKGQSLADALNIDATTPSGTVPLHLEAVLDSVSYSGDVNLKYTAKKAGGKLTQ